MSCTSCGSSGTCNCSTIIIPQGNPGQDGQDGQDGISPSTIVEPPGINCPYGGTKITDADGNISYVCNGIPGTSGVSARKFAQTYEVLSIGTGDTFTLINIPYTSISSCGALINTCASTPKNIDFVLAVWYSSAITGPWLNLNDSVGHYGATYDEVSNNLTIYPAAAGYYRIVILG